MIRDCFQTTIPMSRQLYYQFYQLKLKKQILVLDSAPNCFQMDQKLLKQAWFCGSFWTGMSYSLKDSVYGCVKITHVGPSLLFQNSCYENFKTNFCSSFRWNEECNDGKARYYGEWTTSAMNQNVVFFSKVTNHVLMFELQIIIIKERCIGNNSRQTFADLS